MNAIFPTLAVAGSFATLGVTLYLGFHVRRRFREMERGIATVRSLVDDRAKKIDALREAIAEVKKRVDEDGRATRKTLREHRRGFHRRFRELQEGQAEPVAASSLVALNLPYPVAYGNWAIDPLMGAELVEAIEKRRPRVIIELGSGVSSVLIAAALKKLKLSDVRHIIVDHEARFLEETRRRVEMIEPVARTEFWHSPLANDAKFGTPWYTGVTERLGDTQIDLMFVDGPPGSVAKKSRAPALWNLKGSLGKDAVILLDDTNRADEKGFVAAFCAEYPDVRVRIREAGKGSTQLIVDGDVKEVAAR